MSQNTDALWESVILSKFPYMSKQDMTEAKLSAAVSWGFGEKTEMADIYDQYVMVKRLRGIEPEKNY